jgi:hypothetical protein
MIDSTHIDLIATDPLSAGPDRLIRRTQLDDPDIGKQTREGWSTYVYISDTHTMADCPFALEKA